MVVLAAVPVGIFVNPLSQAVFSVRKTEEAPPEAVSLPLM